VEDARIKPRYKVVLEENLLPSDLTIFPNSQEWHKVTQHQCERLVESMPRRMKAVIENLGYSTKY
jgi:hypothetical protein